MNNTHTLVEKMMGDRHSLQGRSSSLRDEDDAAIPTLLHRHYHHPWIQSSLFMFPCKRIKMLEKNMHTYIRISILYICMFVCMYVVYIYVRTYVCLYVCMYVCMYVCVCVCM